MPCTTLDQFISVYCKCAPHLWPVAEGSELPPGLIYRGFTMFGDYCKVGRMLPPGFVEVDAWSNGFRAVWVNRDLRAIVTYCEGDVDVTIDRTLEAFDVRMGKAAEFYA
jgi:hypothetical protein